MTRLLFAILSLALLSCAVPGREYPVSFPISGTLRHGGTPVDVGRVRLQVRSEGNPSIGGHVLAELDSKGRFSFGAIGLRIAGQEYDKRYILFLSFAQGADEATLWRADYSRRRLGAPVELVCDLDRLPIDGPPCMLSSDPSEQPWLVDAGAKDFQKLCADCHGESARGDGPRAATLAHRPPDLTRIAARNGGVFPREAIDDWIDGRTPVADHGEREMPVWGVVLEDQTVPGVFAKEGIRNRIDILALYLETLQQPAGP